MRFAEFFNMDPGLCRVLVAHVTTILRCDMAPVRWNDIEGARERSPFDALDLKTSVRFLGVGMGRFACARVHGTG